jgi:hypothetical protein
MRKLRNPMLGLSNSKFLRVRPEDEASFARDLAKSVVRRGVIQAVAFWGVGKKDRCDIHDKEAMCHLNLLLATLGRDYACGFRLVLLLCDTHAEANEFNPCLVDRYLDSAEALSESFQFESIRLSRLPRAAAAEDDADLLQQMWVRHGIRYLQQAQRVGPTASAERRAFAYLRARLLERSAVIGAFPGWLLLAGDRPSDAWLLPAMPTLFINFSGPGQNQKPWFLSSAEPMRSDRCVESPPQ